MDIRDAPADVYTSKLSAVEKICKSILGIEIEGGGGGAQAPWHIIKTKFDSGRISIMKILVEKHSLCQKSRSVTDSILSFLFFLR